MKKLTILLLLIGGIAYPQFGDLLKKQSKKLKEKTNLEKAWYYLESSPCDFTGMEWLDEELKGNPESKEVLSLKKRCYQHRYDSAYEAFQKNNSDVSAITTLSDVMNSDPSFGDEKINYEVAVALLERGDYKKINEFISRAINFNPTNMDYRWIRVRSNMTSSSHKKEFEQAIEDMEFMKANGANTGRVNQNLGLAYQLLGDLWFRTHVPESRSYTDDDTEYINQVKANYTKALKCYNKANENFQSAADIDNELAEDMRYRIKDVNKKIDVLFGR